MTKKKNKKNKYDEIKDIVGENIKYMDRIEISDIIEIIRPYYTFKKSELIERELKNKARYIIRRFKDEEGVRIYFSDSEGIYVNVEKSSDLVDLSKVNRQLSIKYSGLITAMKKVRNRIKKIVQKFKSRVKY